jgi:hypothetical protein
MAEHRIREEDFNEFTAHLECCRDTCRLLESFARDAAASSKDMDLMAAALEVLGFRLNALNNICCDGLVYSEARHVR